jgi:isocitrate dehydrogenase
MAYSKELILFILRFIETIISLSAKNYELTLVEKTLILKIENGTYEESSIEIFIKHYNSEILSELFDNRITKIEIKS